jgi:MFS transporter, AAHS family, 4-hydroxybenzoate transporter
MAVVDVNRDIDAAPLRGLPTWVILMTTLVLVLDGLDIQIVSLVAPLLTHEFAVTSASLGSLLAAALIGMAVGGFVLGGSGDRWGRRPALLLSVALFGTATVLASRSQGIPELTAWRLLTGIGLGGAIPNAMALLAEFTGPRWRTQAIAAAVIGVPIGGMGGAVIAAHVLAQAGWRTLFIIGGLLPLAALVIIFFLLPESPRFLAMHPQRRHALAALMNRLVGQQRYTAADEFRLSDPALSGARSGIATLIEAPLRGDTTALWLIFLTNMFVIPTWLSSTPSSAGLLSSWPR